MGPKFTMVYILGMICLFVFIFVKPIIRYLLNNIDKIVKKRTLKIFYTLEYIGYALLFVSIFWIFILDTTDELTIGVEQDRLINKVDLIWQKIDDMEYDIYNYAEMKEDSNAYDKWVSYNVNRTDLSFRYIQTSHRNLYVEDQKEVSAIISVILIIVSTLLIGIGRMADVAINLSKYSG